MRINISPKIIEKIRYIFMNIIIFFIITEDIIINIIKFKTKIKINQKAKIKIN